MPRNGTVAPRKRRMAIRPFGLIGLQGRRRSSVTEKKLKPETLGAWVVHHGRKLQSDQRGPAEFSAIDGAAKGSLLLAGMASSDKADL